MEKLISLFLAYVALAIVLSPFIILVNLIVRRGTKIRVEKKITIQYPANSFYPDSFCPYHKVSLLTENEKYIYKELNKIAESKNLKVLAKIRMGDLVNVNYNVKERYFKANLYKISSKHIDFALCEPDTLQPLLLIEVDDSSHNAPERIKRDIFINEVYAKTGYKLLRIYGTQNLHDKITKELDESYSLY